MSEPLHLPRQRNATSRRSLMQAAAAAAVLSRTSLMRAAGRTKMTIHLTCGSIGVTATQREAIDHAHAYGYEAVEPLGPYLATLPEGEVRDLTAEVKARGLVWGNAGLPIEFRREPERFEEGLARLPSVAKALQRAGVTRATTWVLSSHDSLPYVHNLRQHAARLGQCAAILGDHGIRLGLEYLGPKTMWTARRYPFVHTMAEMRDLIAETKKPNIGFVMDSWHWYTAGEGEAELRTLKSQEVVSIDLNDAPAGIPIEQQIDSKRELPMATGVIPMETFLNVLNEIGCDAPARPEPFNAALRAMPKEQALQVTLEAMRKAFGVLR